MADQFGALTLPLAATMDEPIGDPVLGYIGAFLAAIINDVCADAWATLKPRGTSHALPVLTVVANQPQKGRFNSNKLPALFLWRQRGTYEDRSLDWVEETGTIRVLWVFPPDPQEKSAPRFAFASAVAKTVALRLARGRDPAWQLEGDDDGEALDVEADVDSIALSKATEVIGTTYSGSDLDGVIGGAEMYPRLEPTITTVLVSGDPDDPGIPDAGDDGPGGTEVYNTDESIVWTFVDWNGLTRTRSMRLTLANGGETIALGEDVAEVVSVSMPAQLSTLGTFTFGTAAREGRGTIVAGVGQLLCPPRLREWTPEPIEIVVYDAEGRVADRLQYDAVGMTIEIRERGHTDYSVSPFGGAVGADVGIYRSDFLASDAGFSDAGSE